MRAGASRPACSLRHHWFQLPPPMKKLTLALCWLLLPVSAGAQELSGLIEDLESRTQFGIFTDFRTEFNDASRDAEWYSGQVVAHVTTALSKRAQYFTEITISPDRSQSGQVSLERAFFQFSFSDLTRLRVGRIHTPVSHWNATYHHGQYLQTTINRPEMVKSSNRFSPVHSVIVEVSGTLSRGAGAFSYRLGAGASEDHVHGYAASKSLEKQPSAYAGISFQPVRPLGLTLGINAFVEELADHPEQDGLHTHEMSDISHQEIYSAFVRLDRYRWTFLGEALTIANVGNDRFDGTYGYYAQAERQLSGQLERAVVFGRYGHLKKNRHDPFFAEDDCMEWYGITSGVRVNVAPRVAFTTELRMYGEDMSLPNKHLYVQISAAF